MWFICFCVPNDCNSASEVWRTYGRLCILCAILYKCKRAVRHDVEPSFDFDLQNGWEWILLRLKQYSFIFTFGMNHEWWNLRERYPIAMIE